MPSIGPLEVGIVLIIALLVFGPRKLPELGKSVGSGMREFRSSLSGDGEKSSDSKAKALQAGDEMEATTSR